MEISNCFLFILILILIMVIFVLNSRNFSAGCKKSHSQEYATPLIPIDPSIPSHRTKTFRLPDI